jgi:hypothetical protein
LDSGYGFESWHFYFYHHSPALGHVPGPRGVDGRRGHLVSVGRPFGRYLGRSWVYTCPRLLRLPYFLVVDGPALVTEIYIRLVDPISHHDNQQVVVLVAVLTAGHHLFSMQVCALLEVEVVVRRFSDSRLEEDSDYHCVDDIRHSHHLSVQIQDCHFHWALPSHLLDPCQRCHPLVLEEARLSVL